MNNNSQDYTVLPEATLTRSEALNLLRVLLDKMNQQEKAHAKQIAATHPSFRQSARNLIHYLTLRNHEIRPIQEFLHEAGLSSLASSESHTMAQLLQILKWLSPDEEWATEACDFGQSLEARQRHTLQLLGPNSRPDLPHIMVTFSTELAEDRMKIQELLDAGMTIARINCAHDDPTLWKQMINNIRASSAKMGRPCKVYMDLAGPKIRVSEIPAEKGRDITDGLELAEGDVLELTGVKGGVKAPQRRRDGTLKRHATIVVQPKELLSMLRKGEHIYFDDGKFEAKVVETNRKSAIVEVKRISTKKPFLKAEKGVNLPDSDLAISSLTKEDKKFLPFICVHADLVGYSFVSSPADIEELRVLMQKHTTHPPGIVIKVERLAAVQNLPALLLQGMRDEVVGVMIARGDLAVEIGFERLSEIQQEILWICEAAHVPVIWATQVLETMNKTGFATRSEITDAAMGVMAECVMLNKGPYVVKTVETLADILSRLAGHFDKKRYIMRPLSIARNFFERSETEP